MPLENLVSELVNSSLQLMSAKIREKYGGICRCYSYSLNDTETGAYIELTPSLFYPVLKLKMIFTNRKILSRFNQEKLVLNTTILEDTSILN